MFIITHEFFSNGDESQVGARSCDCPEELNIKDIESIKMLMPYEFRISKADDITMNLEHFRGFCDAVDDERAYEALDWQEYYADCELIEFRKGKYWWRLIDEYEEIEEQ